MRTGTKIAIGAGVVGAGALAYILLKRRQEKRALQAAAATASQMTSPDAIFQGAAYLPVNTDISLSPKGTPSKDQNWNIVLKYGDKGGEIETAQKLFNRISKKYGTTPLTVDGNYGNNTEAKKQKIIGTNDLTLSKLYKAVQRVEGNAQGAPSGVPGAGAITAAGASSITSFIDPYGLIF